MAGIIVVILITVAMGNAVAMIGCLVLGRFRLGKQGYTDYVQHRKAHRLAWFWYMLPDFRLLVYPRRGKEA